MLKYLDSTSRMKFLGFMTTKNGNKTADSFQVGQFFYFPHFSFFRKHVKCSLFFFKRLKDSGESGSTKTAWGLGRDYFTPPYPAKTLLAKKLRLIDRC